jgi:uncharacterized protein (TIGR03000 family)
MYSVVLLAALSAADGSVAMGHKAYPTSHCPGYGCPYGAGYHNPNGGDLWPGYSCWGGCGGYASAAYGVPMTPLINPRPPRVPDPDDKTGDGNGKKNGDGKGKKKPADDDDEDDTGKMKKSKPKKPADDEDEDGKTAALITIFLPAGAKLSVDGRPVTAAGVKTFVTPPLQKGPAYYYEVTVETTRHGKPVVQTRRLRLTAGESVHADYRDQGESVASKK